MKRDFQTRLGRVLAEEENGKITHISLGYSGRELGDSSPVLLMAEEQIKEYMEGRIKELSIPFSARGTEYQRSVWNAALKIPYGEVRTYRWISEIAGGSPRSAGNALSANPIPIIIPCHRVIRSDGYIGGFSAGSELKRKLLDMEQLHYGESVLK